MKFKENNLFRSDPESFRNNACVGKNGGPYNLGAYAFGYYRACEAIVESENLKYYIDTMIYPLCFNFRQFLELSLKDFLEEIGKKGSSKHNLKNDWNILKQYLVEHQTFPTEEVDYIGNIIECFVEIDKKSLVFRYPSCKQNKKHLQEWSLISVKVLADNLEKTRDIFELWFYGIETSKSIQ